MTDVHQFLGMHNFNMQNDIDAMSVDADYISHIRKNGTTAGLEGMELTGDPAYRN